MITWMKKSVPWTAVHVFHHVPDQHFSLGRGGAVESGNLSPGTQVCPAKAHYILSNVCCFIQVSALYAYGSYCHLSPLQHWKNNQKITLIL